jgi:hypothetical protein
MDSVHFDIGLSGTYWSRKPEYSVLVNDTEYDSGPAGEFTNVSFTAELAADTDHVLKIKLLNKTPLDTITDNNVIVQDMLLNIHSIKINQVDIGLLLWSHSRYWLDSPRMINGQITAYLDRCVNLGWNGTYEFKFTTPFYHWLLDNL